MTQKSIFFTASILIITLFTAGPPAHSQTADESYSRRTSIQFGEFRSSMLEQDVTYSVYLPPSYYEEPARCYPVLYYIHGFDLKGKAYADWENWRVDETMDNLIAAGLAQEMIIVIPECFITGLVVNWGERPSRSLPAAAFAVPFRAARGVSRTTRDVTHFGAFLFMRRWRIEPANYTDFFVSEMFAYFESNFRIKKGASNRAITGFSTGGYSSLSIAFRYPELFDSVSAHAPMLVLGSPFSSRAEEYFVEYDPQHTRSVPHRFIISLLKRIFRDEETWDRQNPLWLASRQPLEDLPIYLDVAENDKRGYDVAACALVRTLLERGAPVDFMLLRELPPETSHTYPGYLNGILIAAYAEGRTDREASELFNWKDVKSLINPHVQQIEYSLRFHSREFERQ